MSAAPWQPAALNGIDMQNFFYVSLPLISSEKSDLLRIVFKSQESSEIQYNSARSGLLCFFLQALTMLSSMKFTACSGIKNLKLYFFHRQTVIKWFEI